MKKFLLVSGTLVIAATHAYLQAGSDSLLQQPTFGQDASQKNEPTFEQMINSLENNLDNASLDDLQKIITTLINSIHIHKDISPFVIYKLVGIINTILEKKLSDTPSIHSAPTIPPLSSSSILTPGPLWNTLPAPSLSTSTIPDSSAFFLDNHSATITSIGAIGGTAVVGEDTVEAWTTTDENEYVGLLVLLDTTFYRPYTETKTWYGFRVGVEDIEKNAKNVVLQTAIPKWYCFELIDGHIPRDFTLFSEDNAKTRKRYDKKMTNAAEKEEGFKSPMLCDLTHIKILLPQDKEFFGEGAFGFTIKPTTTATKKLKEHCLEFTASADNAQYVEEKFCVKAM